MKRRGFTLIELMLVIIIIGILAVMVMPRLVGRTDEARAAAASADVNSTIPMALDLFELDNGRFPSTEEGLSALRVNGANLQKWKGPYLKKEPKDPWGKTYMYRRPGLKSKDYDVYSAGPNGALNDDDDIGNW